MSPRENRMRVAAQRAERSQWANERIQRLGGSPSAATLAAFRRAQRPKVRSGRKAESNRDGTQALRAERVA